MKNEIKQILIDGRGWIYAEKQIDFTEDTTLPMGTFRIEKNPIERFDVMGEMANVNWYRQGNMEFNGKYVIAIECKEKKEEK